MNDNSRAVINFLEGVSRLMAEKPVYPGYIATRIKQALKSSEYDGIIKKVGDIQSIGSCRYAIPVTDFEGQSYRVTVEVEKHP